MNRALIQGVIASVIVLLVSFGFVRSVGEYGGDGLLHVDFLDVGQGDATLITAPNGTQVLIDGGRDARVLHALPGVMPYFDRSIDLVVATHPDLDHIGGLIDVLARYRVLALLMTDNESDTPAYTALIGAVEREGGVVHRALRGQVYDLGWGEAGSTTLTVLFPDRDVREVESNTSSIVLKLSYGETDVLLMGDAPQAIETYLVALDEARLSSEVLKVGHHGSRTSSAPLFVETVRPAIAIISAGKENTYGHPHKEVLETLRTFDVRYLGTAEYGTISLWSDGTTIDSNARE